MILPNRNFVDRTGFKYARLTVLELDKEKSKKPSYFWKCRCDCGKELTVVVGNLTHGHTKSCGCFKRENTSRIKTTHGESVCKGITAEYRTWLNMKNRCLNPIGKNYNDYGGRGIRVCNRWLKSYESFLSDMGRRPTPIHTIERRNNNGNYCPSNCLWDLREVQPKNRRSNVVAAHNGRKQIAIDWAKETGINYRQMLKRLHQGWSIRKIISVYG